MLLHEFHHVICSHDSRQLYGGDTKGILSHRVTFNFGDQISYDVTFFFLTCIVQWGALLAVTDLRIH